LPATTPAAVQMPAAAAAASPAPAKTASPKQPAAAPAKQDTTTAKSSQAKGTSPKTTAGTGKTAAQPVAKGVIASSSPAAAENAEWPPEVVNWSAADQQKLEAALKKFPSTLTDRWDQIAADLGKTKKDCVARFKYLVSIVKSGKK